MAEAWPRAGIAVLLILGVGLLLARLRRVPRDLALAVFAACAAALGIFAVFGPTAAAIGGAVIVGAFAVGAALYGLVALLARLAR